MIIPQLWLFYHLKFDIFTLKKGTQRNVDTFI